MPKPVSIVLVIDSIETPMPVADAVLAELLAALAKSGIEATIKLTGERARQLRQRGARAVLDALKTQDIGMRGNYHAGKPTAAELIGDLGWMEGARKFFISEAPGYDDVSFVGGRIPSSYGNESFLPQAYGALSRWGIRVVVGRHSFLSNHDRPFFFGARLNLSRLGPNWIDAGALLAEPGGADRVYDRVAERVGSFSGKTGAVVLHLYAEDLWAKRTPDYWKTATETTFRDQLQRGSEERSGALANFGALLGRLKSLEGAEVHSARNFADRFADISYERRIQMEDLLAIAHHAAKGELRPFRIEAGYLAPSEQLYLLARAWDETRRKGKLVRNSTLQAPLGPAGHVATEPSVSGIQAKELPDILANLLAFIHKFARLPDSVETEDGIVSIEDLLPTLAGGFHDELEAVDLPLRYGVMANIGRVDEALARECWESPVHAPGFQSFRQLTFARQQLWTYKPVLDFAG